MFALSLSPKYDYLPILESPSDEFVDSGRDNQLRRKRIYRYARIIALLTGYAMLVAQIMLFIVLVKNCIIGANLSSDLAEDQRIYDDLSESIFRDKRSFAEKFILSSSEILIVNVCAMTFTIILIVGLHREQRELILSFMIFGAISMIAYIIYGSIRLHNDYSGTDMRLLSMGFVIGLNILISITIFYITLVAERADRPSQPNYQPVIQYDAVFSNDNNKIY